MENEILEALKRSSSRVIVISMWENISWKNWFYSETRIGLEFLFRYWEGSVRKSSRLFVEYKNEGEEGYWPVIEAEWVTEI